jgi:hypothetical protein
MASGLRALFLSVVWSLALLAAGPGAVRAAGDLVPSACGSVWSHPVTSAGAVCVLLPTGTAHTYATVSVGATASAFAYLLDSTAGVVLASVYCPGPLPCAAGTDVSVPADHTYLCVASATPNPTSAGTFACSLSL